MTDTTALLVHANKRFSTAQTEWEDVAYKLILMAAADITRLQTALKTAIDAMADAQNNISETYNCTAWDILDRASSVATDTLMRPTKVE